MGSCGGGSAATPSVAGTVTSYTPVIKSGVKSVSSANYTGLETDGYNIISVSTGATSTRDYTPPQSGDSAGRVITIVKSDTGTGQIQLDASGNGLLYGIEGPTNNSSNNRPMYMSTKGAACTIISDGSSWYISSYPFSGQLITASTWAFAGGTGGGNTSTGDQLIVSRTGAIAHLFIPATNCTRDSGTTNTTFTWNGSFPTWARPGNQVVVPVQVSSNAVTSLGCLKLTTAGAIVIYFTMDMGATAWPSTVTSGFTNNINVSYYAGTNI